MRNGNVSAVVGLDGTYGFKGSTRVLTGSYGYGPWNMRADFLDLRRAQGQQEADLDLSAVRSFHHADLTLVTMTGMHHSDFTSFAMEAQRFGVSISPKYANTGWNRDTAQRGYEQAARIVLEFLNERMINGNRVGDSLQEMIRGIDGGTFAHLSAGPSAPSPQEAVWLARDRGFEALRTLLVSACGEPPAIGCIDANMFNSKGYELLGQRANDALVLFKIAVWSNPMSANAQDSLADGYAAVGDSKGAREAIQQAIELARKDPAIVDTSKASFIAQEKKAISRIHAVVRYSKPKFDALFIAVQIQLHTDGAGRVVGYPDRRRPKGVRLSGCQNHGKKKRPPERVLSRGSAILPVASWTRSNFCLDMSRSKRRNGASLQAEIAALPSTTEWASNPAIHRFRRSVCTLDGTGRHLTTRQDLSPGAPYRELVAGYGMKEREPA